MPKRQPTKVGVDFQTLSTDGDLVKVLQLVAPPFLSHEIAFRQIRYISEYVVKLGAKSVAIENHYIDRYHMEDHSVFYSKSLFPFPNFCRRVHFFNVDQATVRRRLQGLLVTGLAKGLDELQVASKEFCESTYLGFTIIKPLTGSPVGRTVLRPYPEVPEDHSTGFRRDFGAVREYSLHLFGVELTVRGLAFQQQDVGVSACATTAIWSAMQKMRDHEDIAAFTPAQITILASRYSLPFGRSMPSEGLSLDQMCQATQALGAAPNVVRTSDFATFKSYLHTTLRSGFAPILILESTIGRHAVAVAGMKLSVKSLRPAMTTSSSPVNVSSVYTSTMIDTARMYLAT
ncbi:MAG: hypothetical protein IPK83_19650 [Planctomycetes bacterium]|nr:hypothetical protein [Planctomycetota bacterium]